MKVSILHDSDAEIAAAIRLIQIAEELTGSGISTLRALYRCGPLNDGDIPSKAGLDELIEKGLAARIVQKGEYGYNACTYKGGQLFLFLVATEVIKN